VPFASVLCMKTTNGNCDDAPTYWFSHCQHVHCNDRLLRRQRPYWIPKRSGRSTTLIYKLLALFLNN